MSDQTTAPLPMPMLPVAAFVAVKTAASVIITGLGVFVTVSWSLRTARGEGLVFAQQTVTPA